MDRREEQVPAEGTKEYKIYMLKKVSRWLHFMAANPKKNNRNEKLIRDELDAVNWAIKELQ